MTQRLALLLALALPASALASPTYPPRIKSQLSMSVEPQCTLCHTTNTGGRGTVTTPFGRTAMNTYGLTSNNVNLLATVLQRMEADGVDSDGDGTGDIAELRAGRNPNVAATPGVDGGPGGDTLPGTGGGGTADGGGGGGGGGGGTGGEAPPDLPAYGCSAAGGLAPLALLALGALSLVRRRRAHR